MKKTTWIILAVIAAVAFIFFLGSQVLSGADKFQAAEKIMEERQAIYLFALSFYEKEKRYPRITEIMVPMNFRDHNKYFFFDEGRAAIIYTDYGQLANFLLVLEDGTITYSNYERSEDEGES